MSSKMLHTSVATLAAFLAFSNNYGTRLVDTPKGMSADKAKLELSIRGHDIELDIPEPGFFRGRGNENTEIKTVEGDVLFVLNWNSSDESSSMPYYTLTLTDSAKRLIKRKLAA